MRTGTALEIYSVISKKEVFILIQSIEDLVFYELNHHVIEQRDVVYVRNQLYRLLSLDLTEPLPEPKDILYPAIAIETILNDLELKGLLDGSKVSRDLLDTKLMTVFTSKPSEVESSFFKLYKQDKQSATNWYYDYVHHINYIRTERIMKNQSFITPSKYGNLEITINLSKPEKDPKSIALSASAKSSEYPKCLLCVENEGFAGNFSRDARDNHRMIGFDLNGSNYYFQYSPYIYYNEHAIILNALHKPMKIDGQTFDNLLTLCDTFEGYFFGSNADLVKHQPWIDHLKKLSPTKDSIDDIIRHATGEVFMQVLEDCGVFKMNKLGISTFKRFIEEEIL